MNPGWSVSKTLDAASYVQVVSITFDSRRVTTSTLARYRSRFEVWNGWSFRTGSPATIDPLAKMMEIRPKRTPVPDSVAEDSLGYDCSPTSGSAQQVRPYQVRRDVQM